MPGRAYRPTQWRTRPRTVAPITIRHVPAEKPHPQHTTAQQTAHHHAPRTPKTQ